MATRKLKNTNFKKREKGSESGKIKKKLNLEFIKDPTPLDLKPTSPQVLRANPGGAIHYYGIFTGRFFVSAEIRSHNLNKVKKLREDNVMPMLMWMYKE